MALDTTGLIFLVTYFAAFFALVLGFVYYQYKKRSDSAVKPVPAAAGAAAGRRAVVAAAPAGVAADVAGARRVGDAEEGIMHQSHLSLAVQDL